MSRLLFPVALLLLTLGCEGPTSPTTVTTIVTLPTAPATTPVVTSPTSPTPTCPTATCGGTTPQVPRMPEILSFGADNFRVHKGGTALLRWEISDPSAVVRIDPGVGNVGAVGFVLVFPTSTTTYTLTARNSLGTVQRTITVVVLADET
jgi:hypothetical protein